jgi:hypothetical protein
MTHSFKKKYDGGEHNSIQIEWMYNVIEHIIERCDSHQTPIKQ